MTGQGIGYAVRMGERIAKEKNAGWWIKLIT